MKKQLLLIIISLISATIPAQDNNELGNNSSKSTENTQHPNEPLPHTAWIEAYIESDNFILHHNCEDFDWYADHLSYSYWQQWFLKNQTNKILQTIHN